MTTDRFSHAYRVDAPPARTYAHLIEPQSYVGLSPLVVEVRDVRDGRYVAVERFRFGPVKWDNLIRVTMTGVPDERVTSSVVSPGWVRLLSTVDLAPDGGGTAITETIELRAPWFLRSFALGQARQVQQARAVELARRMRR